MPRRDVLIHGQGEQPNWPNEGGYSATRGPDGTHWPVNAPAWDTPADVTVSSIAALQAAVGSATPGDVIQMASGTYSGDLALSGPGGGSASANGSILVRPPVNDPLGVVITGALYIDEGPVTVAGFRVHGQLMFRHGDIGGTGNDGRQRYSNFTRIVFSYWPASLGGDGQGAVGGSLSWFDAPNCGAYEVVCVDSPVNDSDRMGLRAAYNACPNGKIHGAYVMGTWRPSGSTDGHNDTFQVYGGPGTSFDNWSFKDSVFLGSAGTGCFQGDGKEVGWTYENCIIQQPGVGSGFVPPTPSGAGGAGVAYSGPRHGYFYDCDIIGLVNNSNDGSPTNPTTPRPLVAHRCVIGSVTAPPFATDMGSGTDASVVDSATADAVVIPAPPTRAQLISMWGG